MPAARDHPNLLLPSTSARSGQVHWLASTEQLGLLQPSNWVAATEYMGSLSSCTYATTIAFRVVGFMCILLIQRALVYSECPLVVI